MNKEQFIDYLHVPDKLKEAILIDLDLLVHDFPYCQSARILKTMKLFVDKNVLYESELKTTAIYVGSRKILKQHIDRLNDMKLRIVLPDEEKPAEYKPVEHKVSKSGPTIEKPAKVDKSDEHRQNETIDPTVENKPDIKKEKPDEEEKGTGVRHNSLEELKKIVEDRIREIEKEKKDQQAKTSKKSKTLRSNEEIIDTFIRNSPTISRLKTPFFDPMETAKQSVVDQENIVSETLANIYVDQRHFEKAINIYKKLSLKFPKKSSYFAGLIGKAEKNLKT